MADTQDLATAFGALQQGVQHLQFSNALDQANQQVQDIKASTDNEQAQRAQLQQVSSGLVQHMALFGVPTDKMGMVANTINPQYGDATSMFKQGALTGDQDLMNQAQATQKFAEQPTLDEINAKNRGAANMYKALNFDEKKDEFNTKQLQKFGTDINDAKASSRSVFGQWAQVDQNGQRLEALMGSPADWKNMSSRTLSLVQEGVVKMTKGGVPTETDNQAQKVLSAAMVEAKAQELVTGKPANIDLSGYMGLYSGMLDREKGRAQSNLVDNVLQAAQGNSKLLTRDEDTQNRFKTTLANELSKVGVPTTASDISYDPEKGLQVAPIEQNIQQQEQMAGLGQKALTAVQSAAASPQEKATSANFLKQYGITPGTSPTLAARIIKAKEKTRMFQ